MIRRTTSRARLLAAALVAAALPALTATAVGSPPPAVAATTTPATVAADAAHPYSNPVWWPLRDVAQSDCEKSNPGCTLDGQPYHGYWALDIDARPPFPSDDPVMAMGAGIFHIGSTSEACPASHSGIGAWVWIDHGNGVRSIYGHLHDVNPALHDGEYVTPTTRLAYVGTTAAGNCAHSTFKYLYVAVKHDSAYVQIPYLYACDAQTGRKETWPQDLGSTAAFANWNTMAVHTPLPAADDSCITPAATPDQPVAPRVTRAGSGALQYRAPAGTASTAVLEVQGWHPSLGEYLPQAKITTTPGATTTLRGLTNGYRYQARVWFANAGGYSAPSAWVTASPATVPQTPPARSVAPFHTGVTFAWVRSNGNGLAVTRYQVGISRTLRNGTHTAWVYTNLDPSLIHHTFSSLARNTTYRLAVRATNAMGNSGWLIRTTRTLA